MEILGALYELCLGNIEENKQLSELIPQMKTIDFKNAGADVIKGIVKDTKFANTIMAFWKLAKK